TSPMRSAGCSACATRHPNRRKRRHEPPTPRLRRPGPQHRTRPAKLRKERSRMSRQERIAALKAAAQQRVLILDGAWGVMIQELGLGEADYRGERFADAARQLKGNNDILCLTRPDVVADLHDQYFAAGADI